MSAILEVFFSRRAGRFNGNNENRPFVRADRNVPMHLIKPALRHQDLEGIHLPSFRFSWKLKKLCRVDFVVFESWPTAEDVWFYLAISPPYPLKTNILLKCSLTLTILVII
jgi:hypothetical protein